MHGTPRELSELRWDHVWGMSSPKLVPDPTKHLPQAPEADVIRISRTGEVEVIGSCALAELGNQPGLAPSRTNEQQMALEAIMRIKRAHALAQAKLGLPPPLT